MIVDLTAMKTYLGISGSTYDTFLTEQLNFAQSVVEAYCRRKFEQTSYVQTFYAADFPVPKDKLNLFQFPVISITHLKIDAVANTDYRLHKPSGIIIPNDYLFFNGEEEIEVSYSAGYINADIPLPIKDAIYSIVQERYNKKISGAALDFGNNVQRVSIPGTISIDFDYSLSSNERSSPFGAILGGRSNMLDYYRSEQLIGNGRLAFIA